jgi:glycosyltransferase involved in cell wall biosynthesis
MSPEDGHRSPLLFLTNLFPFPLDDGATFKTYYTLRYLSRNFEVTLISFYRTQEELAFREELGHFCKDIIAIPLMRSRWRDIGNVILSLFNPKPFLIERDYSRKMSKAIEGTLHQGRFSLIYVDHLHMSQYVRAQEPTKKVLDEHNVEAEIARRYFEIERSWLRKCLAYMDYRKFGTYEPRECRKYDHVFVVSPRDQSLLEDSGVRNVSCIPIGVDTQRLLPLGLNPGSKKIVFIGTMYWPPNIDAVNWFSQEVFPLIKLKRSDCQFLIIGKKPPLSVQKLARDGNILVLGYVEDPTEYLRDCAAFIVPLRIGGGIRVKILNALAWGLPIVSTTVGAEGIAVTSGENILIEDHPEGFAAAVIRLIHDLPMRERLSKNGRQLAVKVYDWEKVYARLDVSLKSSDFLPVRSEEKDRGAS